MEHGNVFHVPWPISSLKTQSKRPCKLDRATTLDVLASRARVKLCKGGNYISNNIQTNANDVYLNRGSESSYDHSNALSALFGFEPSSGHLHSSFPPLEHFSTCLTGYLWLEYRVVLAVNFFQLFEFPPNVYSEASRNGSTERCGLAHHGAVDGYTYEICLCLR